MEFDFNRFFDLFQTKIYRYLFEMDTLKFKPATQFSINNKSRKFILNYVEFIYKQKNIYLSKIYNNLVIV